MKLYTDLSNIVSKLEEKENNNLTVKQIFEILKDTLDWTDNYAKIFQNVSVVPKVHKLEHMIVGKINKIKKFLKKRGYFNW